MEKAKQFEKQGRKKWIPIPVNQGALWKRWKKITSEIKKTGLCNFLPMIFYLVTTDLPICFLSFSVYYCVNLEDDFTQAHQHYDNVGGKYPSRWDWLNGGFHVVLLAPMWLPPLVTSQPSLNPGIPMNYDCFGLDSVEISLKWKVIKQQAFGGSHFPVLC